MKQYILALDQGTTSSRAIVFGLNGNVCAKAQKELRQFYPKPGWVEHDPEEILKSQIEMAKRAANDALKGKGKIAAIAITNQRETIVVWERATGRPVAPAIVWQCRRTSDLCEKLKKAGMEKEIRKKTGLLIDPYFSATKLMWLFDNVPGLRKRAENGEIAFGTIDSWLLFHLTGVHATEPSNASRTMLFNIHSGEWDEEILQELKIPRNVLPAVFPTSGVFGYTEKITGSPLPVSGVAGDQQAALFGQGCIRPGNAKNTYGTGCFLLMHTGKAPVLSRNGLLATVAWDLGKGLEYALEGSIFVAGAALQWLRDEVGILDDVEESGRIAAAVPDTGGCYLVPAFVGLGAPRWRPDVRGALVGLTRGTGRGQIVRAALESIAFQTKDLVGAMEKAGGRMMDSLKADGGACRNDFLMQFQADILGRPVARPRVFESTALGAAFLAGLGVSLWNRLSDVERLCALGDVFKPSLEAASADKKYRLWKKAVAAAEAFAGG
ncbi:MAG: glycerol kinase GlpK [Spirochaetales bacterium]|nr:glycerol kinase GlpK [Spirochaetales bacterium]